MLVVAVSLLGVAGCGDGTDFDRAAAVEVFTEDNADVTSTQADCVIDRLTETYSFGELEDELQAEPLKAKFAEDQFREMFACGVEGDVTDRIIEELEATGVEPGSAPCVADQLVASMTAEDFDVLLSGEITESFRIKFVSSMETCGAIDG